MVAVKASRGCQILYCVLSLLSGFAPCSGHTQPIGVVNTVAGFTPGSFRVNESGAATYTIPIQVPPGTAGLEPKLAVTYNSKGRNGLLGVGWGLSGLSAITRCARTVVQDGVKDGINFNPNDRFCLDGQRLVMISQVPATYGGDSVEYRTERETFSKVISNGQVPAPGTGPQWFKVWTKAGQILEYGNTDDSRIEAQGRNYPTVRLWALNKISDQKGNYLTLTYVEDNPNGDFRPQRIDYTGSTRTGTPPYASVQFSYVDRLDGAPAYVAGSVIKTTNLLTNIKTYVGTSLVKNYRLYYQYSPTMRLNLTSLYECAGQGDEGTCKPATNLTWRPSAKGLFPATSAVLNAFYLSHSNGTYGSLLGDFNGDGKTDILRLSDWSAENNVFLANGDGSFTQVSATYLGNISNSNGTLGSLLGDFNGDGKTDILRWSDDLTLNALFLSNGDGSFTQAAAFNLNNTSLSHSNRTVGIVVGDFNGDGRTDILRWSVPFSNNALFLSNGDGSFTQASTFNLNNTYLGGNNNNGNNNVINNNVSVLGDFNGDGKTDILRLADRFTDNALYLSNGDGSFTQSPLFNINNTPLFSSLSQYGSLLGDFNGDGKIDILRWSIDYWVYQTSRPNALYLSNGDGSFTQAAAFSLGNVSLGSNNNYEGSLLGDFNGDGKTDILRWSGDPTQNILYYSLGDGGFASTYVLRNQYLYHKDPTGNGTMGSLIGDFDGDGVSDVLRWGDNQSNNFLFREGTGISDLVQSVTDGLGAVTSVTYKPLTDNTVYTKFPNAAYPVIDLQAPLHVVSSTSTGDSVGGSYVTNYNYSGLKAHQQGGGLLGFANVVAKDMTTGTKTSKSFRVDYPFQGLLNSVTTSNDQFGLLGQPQAIVDLVTNTWDLSLIPNSTGNYHRSDLIKSVEIGFDLMGMDGSNLVRPRLPTVTTTSTYDSFGNPKSIVVTTQDAPGSPIFTKTITNDYFDPDPVNWILGRKKQSTVTSVTP